MFVIWFVSGIVFVYVGMPTLPAEERLRRMEPLDLTTLRITPAEAAARAVGSRRPACASPCTTAGRCIGCRPAPSGGWSMPTLASLLTRHERGRGDGADATLRARTCRDAHATTAGLTDSDQWTLQSIIRTNMPMHRIALGDAEGTEYYVSEKTGEPVFARPRSGRFWGYLSAVLHWLYFTPLRRHAEFWNSFVVWSSLIGTVMCGMGIVIGIWRYSLSGRFRLRGVPSHTPYAGWMKWHHYAGLMFGFFACTWAFSGALSLGPFAFLRASPPTAAYREAATGGPIDLTPLTVERIHAVAATVGRSFTPKELDFFQFQGEPYFIAYVPPSAGGIAAMAKLGHRGRDQPEHRSRSTCWSRRCVRRPEPSRASTRSGCGTWRGPRCPACRCRTAAWLERVRRLYYSQKGTKPLPVLRVRYADPQQTWLYLDPQRGVIASRTRAREPVESLAVSRLPQPRLSVHVLQASAVGHRRDSAQHRRHRDQRHVGAAGVAAAGAPRQGVGAESQIPKPKSPNPKGTEVMEAGGAG